MVYVHPASGERFYMRLLLNIVVGVKMFEEIRTVDGIVYSTYKEACFHRGLLESGNEWHIALTDASLWASASQLHNLFVTLLVFAKTAHSRFKIPIDADKFSCCEVKQNTFLAELICSTSLVIWDEAPMTHRLVFEAVDRTFRDIRSKVLPVIQKKGREEIVAACISKSPLWQYCKVFTLRENMRIERNVPKVTIRGKKVQFRDWVLSLGDGLEQTIIIGDDPEPSWITLPEEVLVNYSGDAIEAIVNEIYKDLHHRHEDVEYLRNRVVLTPLNEHVDIVNVTVLRRLPGEFKVYKSYDSICKGSSTSEADEVLYPPEYLNSLKSSGMQNHEIAVKVGAPIMLLRNLNAKKGLCNGTRLIITRCYPFLIEALIITGTRIGDTTYVPRITMCPADKAVPFILKRKQFLIAVCYAMTVNKSQGQTVQNVGLYLPDPVFGHDQMYVTVSRVTSPNGLKIVTVDDNEVTKGYTKNIVYRVVFDNLVQSLSLSGISKFVTVFRTVTDSLIWATAYVNDGLVFEAERNISTVENLIEPITELPKFALGSTIAPIKYTTN
ncbi:uncharacterized protein LOC141696182 [Apium graveolens]|uniref:uncharacterized protein LOC141696182 n=1 Tax=Apium graveolens TaxID=4045 RepID=UPI003D79837D